MGDSKSKKYHMRSNQMDICEKWYLMVVFISRKIIKYVQIMIELKYAQYLFSILRNQVDYEL